MFFLTEFWYEGKKVSEECQESIAALDKGERNVKMVAQRLLQHGITTRHAYSWPDGSLYYFFKAQLLGHEKEAGVVIVRITRMITETLQEFGMAKSLGVREIGEITSNHDPHKEGCKTVREYFEGISS